MNTNKVLLTASVIALAGILSASAEAGCTPKNGVYFSIGAGYGVTIVKDEVKTKAGKISYKEKTTTIKSEASADAKADLDADSKKKLEEYKAAYVNFEKNVLRPFGAAAAGGADGPIVAANPFGILFTNAGNAQLAIAFAAVAAANDGAGHIADIPANAIIEAPIVPAANGVNASSNTMREIIYRVGQLILKNLPEGYKIFTGDRELTNRDQIGISATLPVTANFSLAANSAGTIDAITLREPDGTAHEIVSANTVFATAAAAGDGAASALRYSQIMRYVNNMVVNASKIFMQKTQLGDLKVDTSAITAASKISTTAADKKDATTHDIASAVTTINQSKGLMNINVTVGGQYGFDGFYVAGELGAMFVPGKVEIHDVTVNGSSKAHTIGDYSVQYASAVNAEPYKLELAEKYSFHFTPMIGFQVGTAIVGIKAPLRWVKHELTLTPSTAATGPESLLFKPELGGTDTEKTFTSGTTEFKLLNASGAAVSGSGEQKKDKSTFLVEFGPFVRFMLSDSTFIGLDYTYGPAREIELTTDAYQTSYVHDTMSLGADHKLTVSSHKCSLSFGLVF